MRKFFTVTAFGVALAAGAVARTRARMVAGFFVGTA